MHTLRHKIGNVLAALPKSAQPGAKRALAETYNAEDREHTAAAAKAFADLYGAIVAQGGRENHRRPRRAAGVL